ncbi:MAG: hypothetical protein WCH09_04305 [Bacteroidota bacterium]
MATDWIETLIDRTVTELVYLNDEYTQALAEHGVKSVEVAKVIGAIVATVGSLSILKESQNDR